jgi:hypothetical protein
MTNIEKINNDTNNEKQFFVDNITFDKFNEESNEKSNEKSFFYIIILNILEFINYYIYIPCMNVFMNNSGDNLDKPQIINPNVIKFNESSEKYINLDFNLDLITDIDEILDNIIPDKSLYKIE